MHQMILVLAPRRWGLVARTPTGAASSRQRYPELTLIKNKSPREETFPIGAPPHVAILRSLVCTGVAES